MCTTYFSFVSVVIFASFSPLIVSPRAIRPSFPEVFQEEAVIDERKDPKSPHRNSDETNFLEKPHRRGRPEIPKLKAAPESERFLPPDHIDAARLEVDGDINKDFHKEVLLGDHEDLESRHPNKTDDILRIIFDKVDVDGDGLIERRELEDWIDAKILEHINEAVKDNSAAFEKLDPDKDGYVTWKEYFRRYLLDKNLPADLAEERVENYETLRLPDEDKDKIVRFQFRWNEADEEPQDNRLTEKEFLSFMHPEHSPKMLDAWVIDIMRGLDADGDGIITEAEFAALPEGQVDEQWAKADRDWQDERRKEFRRVIDLDNDGRVSQNELKNYVDPKNPKHARAEARNLIDLVDRDHDEKLSLEELIAGKDIILLSKMVDTGQSLHDEF